MSRMQNAYQRNSEISIFYKNVVFLIWVGVFFNGKSKFKNQYNFQNLFHLFFIVFLFFFPQMIVLYCFTFD